MEKEDKMRDKKGRFKKGHGSIPGAGRPKMSEEMKNIRAYLPGEVAKIFTFLMVNNLEEVENIAESETESMLAKMVASIMLKTVETGDVNKLNGLLDRILGKAPNEIHHKGDMFHALLSSFVQTARNETHNFDIDNEEVEDDD